MLGARIRLGLDDVEGPVDREVEGQVGLRVVREGQLLDRVGSVIGRNRPFLNLNLFAAFQPARLIDAQLWRNRVRVEFECDCTQ